MECLNSEYKKKKKKKDIGAVKMNKDEENTEHKEEMKEPSLPSAPLRSYPHQKIFKKCKSATFRVDDAIYTIGKFPK